MANSQNGTGVRDTNLPGNVKKISLVFDPKDPLGNARKIHNIKYKLGDDSLLYRYKGDFYIFSKNSFSKISEETIISEMWHICGEAVKGDGNPYQPNSSRVKNTFDALKAITKLDDDIIAPCWLKLDFLNESQTKNVIPCNNGLLNLSTNILCSPTPKYFCFNGLPVNYKINCKSPTNWLSFLNQLWPDDDESKNTLQEIFGYLLTTDTRQQKIFLVVGPKRAGKGTIIRVLRGLLGDDNVCSPTLGSLSANFGLGPLIGKQLAVIADARLSGRADQASIAERLLSISGEDPQTIDRKFKDSWNGYLQTRFAVFTNELPRLADTSGALASRFIVLTLQNSFYGKEDTRLFDRLQGELSSILNWALVGLRRLNDRGHFVQPCSSVESISELEDLGSPMSAFVRDCCDTRPTNEVMAEHLYEAWCHWCKDNGRNKPGTLQTFARDLRGALPGLRKFQPRTSGGRKRCYRGIGLNTDTLEMLKQSKPQENLL